MIQVSRAPLIQADRAVRMTLQSDVLTGLPERLQVLAVAVLQTVIEKVVDHLLAVREVLTELGSFYALVSVTVFPEPECRAVMLLDGSDECLDLEGDVGLG